MLSRFFSPSKIVYSSLREHLIAKINSDYLDASVVTKWIDWIGSAGINRANHYIKWLGSDEIFKLNDYQLAEKILDSFREIPANDGVSLFESKNLRLLVARETFEYLNGKEPTLLRNKNKADYDHNYSQGMVSGHKIPGHASYLQTKLSIGMIKIIVDARNMVADVGIAPTVSPARL